MEEETNENMYVYIYIFRERESRSRTGMKRLGISGVHGCQCVKRRRNNGFLQEVC